MFKPPSWEVTGQLSEVRELKAKDGGKVFAYVAKVQALGGTFELQTRDSALFGKFAAGDLVKATGGFEFFNNAAKFNCSTIVKVAA